MTMMTMRFPIREVRLAKLTVRRVAALRVARDRLLRGRLQQVAALRVARDRPLRGHLQRVAAAVVALAGPQAARRTSWRRLLRLAASSNSQRRSARQTWS